MPQGGEAARPALNPFGGELLEVGARASRPQSLIISVYGSYVRAFDNWFPVSLIVRLLEDLDVDEVSTRKALSRLKARRIFASQERNGQVGYSFTPNALTACIANDQSIYGRREPPEDSGWVLASFSIPEKSRSLRYQLKAQLTRLGFAQVDAGLVIGPAHLRGQLHDVVARLDLTENVQVFLATYEGFGTVESEVEHWWDLTAIASTYTTFVDMYQPMATTYLRSDATPEPGEAFRDYMRLMTAWRTLPVFDPGLPPVLLPSPWPGFEAARLFYSLHDRISQASLDHVSEAYARLTAGVS